MPEVSGNGYRLQTTKMCLVQALQHSIREISSSISVRKAISLLGLITAAIPAGPWAQIHSRPLQLQILDDWDHTDPGLDKRLELSESTLSSLLLVEEGEPLDNRQSLGKDRNKNAYHRCQPNRLGRSSRREYVPGHLGTKYKKRIFKFQRADGCPEINHGSKDMVKRVPCKNTLSRSKCKPAGRNRECISNETCTRDICNSRKKSSFHCT